MWESKQTSDFVDVYAMTSREQWLGAEEAKAPKEQALRRPSAVSMPVGHLGFFRPQTSNMVYGLFMDLIQSTWLETGYRWPHPSCAEISVRCPASRSREPRVLLWILGHWDGSCFDPNSWIIEDQASACEVWRGRRNLWVTGGIETSWKNHKEPTSLINLLQLLRDAIFPLRIGFFRDWGFSPFCSRPANVKFQKSFKALKQTWMLLDLEHVRF